MVNEPIIIGSRIGEYVTCSNCETSLLGADAYCYRGKKGEDVYFCPECKQQVDAALQQETVGPNFFGAIALGVLAGIAAGAVWFAVEVLTGYRIGYIALGAGYLIGWAVVWGSGKRRGSALQLISTILTLLSVGGASYFSAVYTVNKYISDKLVSQGVKAMHFFWISPFNPALLKMIISPMGVLIWGIALYIAFRTPQARKI